MKLSAMFEACLRGPYTHVENGGDFRFFREGDRLWTFFPHSDGAVDWKNNLDFPIKAYARGDAPRLYVHRGFLRVWRSIEPHLAPLFADPSVRSVVAVGYSHGGALALLCYEYVIRVRPDLRERTAGYGFGAPRVLWGIRTPSLAERFRRFTVVRNRDDIVTHLPPAALGYFHAGEMLEIGQKGKYSRVDAHRPENLLREIREHEEVLAKNAFPR